HRKESLPRAAAMSVAIASAHRAQRRAKVGANRVEDRLPKGEPAGLIANERSEHVSFPQRQSDRHAQCLLPAPKKNATVKFSRAVKAGKLVVQRPRQQHPAKRFCVFVTES